MRSAFIFCYCFQFNRMNSIDSSLARKKLSSYFIIYLHIFSLSDNMVEEWMLYYFPSAAFASNDGHLGMQAEHCVRAVGIAIIFSAQNHFFSSRKIWWYPRCGFMASEYVIYGSQPRRTSFDKNNMQIIRKISEKVNVHGHTQIIIRLRGDSKSAPLQITFRISKTNDSFPPRIIY